jgi:hypothetical protein
MPNGRRVVLWQSVGEPDLQQCQLSRLAAGWRLDGTVVTVADEEPTVIRYQVDIDQQWATRRVLVNAAIGLQLPVQIGLGADAAGEWHAVRQPDATAPWVTLPDLAGLVDIDLAFTPATNTLPIRRLQPAVGETIAVTAVWLRFPELDIQLLPQTYQRLDDHRYRYESDGGAFTAEITVDELGLVVDYEGLWTRVVRSRDDEADTSAR